MTKKQKHRSWGVTLDVIDEYSELAPTEVMTINDFGNVVRVYWCGDVVRVFRGKDAPQKAAGYALALMEGRIR